MCGRETENPISSSIEGVNMKVCTICSKYGTPVKKEPTKTHKDRTINNAFNKKRIVHVKEMESTESIVDDYAERIRDSRQKKQWPQNALAIKLAEKESVIHSIETGKHEPNIALAKKIEKVLKIRLIESKKTDPDEDVLKEFKRKPQKEQDEVTLGDIITFRKRK